MKGKDVIWTILCCDNVLSLLVLILIVFREHASCFKSASSTALSSQNHVPSEYDRSNPSSSGLWSKTNSLPKDHHHDSVRKEAQQVSQPNVHSSYDYQTSGSSCEKSDLRHDKKMKDHIDTRSNSKECFLESVGNPGNRSNYENNNQRNSGQHEKNEKRTKSISNIVEPLNAQRLKPIRQKTRNAVVSITENNEVCLEFLQQKGEQNYVLEVVRISCNGMKITTYVPNGRRGILLSHNLPPLPSDTRAVSNYLYCSLPFKYWKKYQYAARFVDLVRKKTPKITLYTRLAKCMLMENSPNADFEACFYNGMKYC